MLRNRRLLLWAVIFACLIFGVEQVVSVSTREDSSDLIISELLASNGIGLTDEDGDYSDWIEIYNRSDRAINLSGWSLTDDSDQPEKWTFPAVTLGSREYLVVFASGKNRKSAEPGSELHTNFRLDREGEFVGLYNILYRTWMDEISPEFPEQLRDMSYGRYDGKLAYGYFAEPTPGEPNDETLVWGGIVSSVDFSVERGFYESPFTVELSTTTPGATIRYTIDGSQPTETSGMIYTQPIPVTTTSTLRAVAFKSNFLQSQVDTHTYIFLNDVLAQPDNPSGFPATWGIHLKNSVDGDKEYTKGSPVIADYEMDPEIVNDPRYRDTIKDDLQSIPTLSIVTDMRDLVDIYTNPRERGIAWERPVSVELIYPDDREGFQINAGIRIQGGYGRLEHMIKHSFRLFFKSEYGPTKLEYSLFPDSTVETFDTIILRGGVNRGYVGHGASKQNHRLATYTRDEWLRASQIAMSGVGSHGIFVHLYLDGLYWGLYNVVERPDASFTSAYLGGRKEEWCALNHDGLISGSDERVKALEYMFVSDDFEEIEDTERYAIIKSYVDTIQLSDFLILNWYAGNTDWPESNWYAGVRNPDGKIRFFVWDGENTWKDGAEIVLDEDSRPNKFKSLFEVLMQCPDFRIDFADRMYKHLFNDGALADANSQARWMRINNLIDRAIVGESARWGDARYIAPITRDDWLKARDDVLAQMDGNAAKLIAMTREAGYYPAIDPPVFNQHGGLVTRGFELNMSASQGTIYYTTDGSDPRIQVTGAVAPSAVIYDSPVVLTDTTHIKARVLDGGDASTSSGQAWSALHEATFRVVEYDSKLRITEMMYNPIGGDDYEFVELKNTGEVDVDLSSLSFEGIRFTFPASTDRLAPGELIVLVRNPTAFKERYPGVPVSGVYQGQLSNKGEKITLKDPMGNVVTSVEYDDENGWPISPDGRGDSLVFVDLNGDPHDPKNWRASVDLYGSPGTDDPAP